MWLHFSLTYLCSYILRPTDFDVVATKLESALLTPFDTTTLPNIPVPKFPNERTCAWLNSTHLRRRGLSEHPDESHGTPVPLSPPTSRAEQMERDICLPVTRTPMGFFDCSPEYLERTPWYYSPWPSAYHSKSTSRHCKNTNSGLMYPGRRDTATFSFTNFFADRQPSIFCYPLPPSLFLSPPFEFGTPNVYIQVSIIFYTRYCSASAGG